VRPRLQFTVRRMMLAVAAFGISLSVAVSLTRSPSDAPMRILRLILSLVAWTVTVNLCGFACLWLLVGMSKVIYGAGRRSWNAIKAIQVIRRREDVYSRDVRPE
jgi:hypothetical protein